MLNFLKNPTQSSRCFFAGLDALARHRLASIVLIGCLSFGGCWLWALFRGIPIPFVMDEYSYLLAGDTFAHGRVTNPAHPMWIHFQAFYILQHPTYMSIYPPGQGAFLALGKILFGRPVYGVWLSSALMCMAIAWMFYAWFSPRWALIGGLVAVLQFGIFTYWNQSYWGGAVAGIGGALVFGALPRIFRTQRIRDALWLGLGCAVLANSRPLEGFLIAVPVACLALPWKIRWKELILTKFIKRAILPLILVLLMTLLGMGTYNKQITGNSKILPHLLYNDSSRYYPLFIWQPLVPQPRFIHKTMEVFQKNFIERYYLDKKTWKGFMTDMRADSFRLSAFFFGYPLSIPSTVVLLLLFSQRQKAARLGAALLILLGGCAALAFPAEPHYLSPLTCLVVLLITIGLRGLSCLKFRKARIGLLLVIFLMSCQMAFDIVLTPRPPVWSIAYSIQASSFNLPASFSREELKNLLLKKGGKYLVIVHYFFGHNFFREWVYNDADIDHAPIVWARDMGTTDNAELLNYFKDRQVIFINILPEKGPLIDFSNRQEDNFIL